MVVIYRLRIPCCICGKECDTTVMYGHPTYPNICGDCIGEILLEYEKEKTKMFTNTVSTGPCGEPISIPEPTLCDKCHALAADVHENIIHASRIREVLLGSNKNNDNARPASPSCMDEEFTLIHEDLQYLRKILLDINERL